MARMTTARAIVRSLAANGVDTVFGLPGVQLDALFNALHDERTRIRVIHPATSRLPPTWRWAMRRRARRSAPMSSSPDREY